jgi:MarR family transcriptional regulator, organic hydroperoxide resistance regulator
MLVLVSLLTLHKAAVKDQPIQARESHHAMVQNSRMPRANRHAEISARILKHWHHAVQNDRMAHLVKDASRSFLRSLQVRLAMHGVSLGHWTFLRILWEQDGLTQRELSEEAGLMEPTTFAALRAMEELGYITRERRPENRKNMYVHLTAKGKALKHKLVPMAEEVNAVALKGLKGSEVDSTRRCLLVMLDNLAQDEALAPPEREPGD